MILYLNEQEYRLANGKIAIDSAGSKSSNMNTVSVDINNPVPVDLTNKDKDYNKYKNAKPFSSDENGAALISKLKSGAVIITDKTGIQLYIMDNEKQEHIFVYNRVITDKETAKDTTQNIINKLKAMNVESTIEKTSSVRILWEILVYVSISSIVRLSIASSSPSLAAAISFLRLCSAAIWLLDNLTGFLTGSKIIPPKDKADNTVL